MHWAIVHSTRNHHTDGPIANQALTIVLDQSEEAAQPQQMKVRLPNGQKYDGLWTDGQMQRASNVRNRRNSETTYYFH